MKFHRKKSGAGLNILLGGRADGKVVSWDVQDGKEERKWNK